MTVAIGGTHGQFAPRPMLRLLLPALLLSALLACGIKGPPRPPLHEVAPPAPAHGSPPDAGCCQEAR